MGAMDKRVVVTLQDQTVVFKYKGSPKDQLAVDLEQESGIRTGMTKAVVRARNAAATAHEAFDAYLNGRTGKATSLIPAVLRNYFAGASSNAQMTVIRDTFASTTRGLSADLTIADSPREDGAEGAIDPRTAYGGATLMNDTIKALRDSYVQDLRGPGMPADHFLYDFARAQIQRELLIELGVARLRSIHIAYRHCRFRPVDYMACVIVHEATHKFASTGDAAYCGGGAFPRMPPDIAIINADSYAYASIALLRQRIVSFTELAEGTPAAADGGGGAGTARSEDARSRSLWAWLVGRK